MLLITLKALHLISMVGWFVGLFYIFRIFMYHIEAKEYQESIQLLKKMSYKLYFFMMTPFMVLTLFFGFWLLVQAPFYLTMGWFHIKLTLLAFLILHHIFIGYILSRFQKDQLFLSKFQCMLLSHISGTLLTLIILVAAWRPSF